MTQDVKLGQVRMYSHHLSGELIYLVIDKQEPPWINHALPFEWVLLILDVTGVHYAHMAPHGSVVGADDYWLMTNTVVID